MITAARRPLRRQATRFLRRLAAGPDGGGDKPPPRRVAHYRGPNHPPFFSDVPGNDFAKHCRACDVTLYENPKLICGVVATWRDSNGDLLYLLGRRGVNPRAGYWGLCAGYMEIGETLAEGAQREAREETAAELRLGGILCWYDLVYIGQILVYYNATLLSPEVRAIPPETTEVGLFRWEDIPWDELAFPANGWALEAHRREVGRLAALARGGAEHATWGPPYGLPPECHEEGKAHLGVWFDGDKFVHDDRWGGAVSRPGVLKP
mmetsp:Transcript_5023/g.16877  ORF Transcript_5023/g.16877 Transcript_5023/m.16877 type:complete len:264 (-) Transcript_5023:31-822(-)